jgi:hypothetical protein
MTLIDIIKAAITDAGGDGLVNGFAECGCSIDDLAPCEGPDITSCQIANARTLGPDEYEGDCGPGDQWFTVI